MPSQKVGRFIQTLMCQTHRGLVTTFSDISVIQPRRRYWLVAWWHEVSTRTNVNFALVRLCSIHLRVISPWPLQLFFWMMSLKIIFLNSLPNLPEANELYLRWHYNDVIMGAMASQITSLITVYSTVYSGTDHRNHRVTGLCAGNSPVTSSWMHSPEYGVRQDC